MKISKNSTLYKSFNMYADFYEVRDADTYKDLCTFIRHYLIRVVCSTVLFTFAFTLCSVTLFTYAALIFNPYASMALPQVALAMTAIVSAAIVSILSLYILLKLGAVWSDYKYKRRRLKYMTQHTEDETASTWNVFCEYVRSKKEKYCPRIEFKD